MGDEWKDKGHHGGALSDIGRMITGTEERHVVNTKTGEEKIAIVGPNQTVGEAIEKSQLRDNDCTKK